MTDNRMRPIDRDPNSYQCCYCSQRCSSVGILASHERDCPMRYTKEKEWKEERRKYINRYNARKQYKEI